eukprot:Polyplicarium_translucidae@DN2480_c1_g1_i1.p2
MLETIRSSCSAAILGAEEWWEYQAERVKCANSGRVAPSRCGLEVLGSLFDDDVVAKVEECVLQFDVKGLLPFEPAGTLKVDAGDGSLSTSTPELNLDSVRRAICAAGVSLGPCENTPSDGMVEMPEWRPPRPVDAGKRSLADVSGLTIFLLLTCFLGVLAALVGSAVYYFKSRSRATAKVPPGGEEMARAIEEGKGPGPIGTATTFQSWSFLEEFK